MKLSQRIIIAFSLLVLTATAACTEASPGGAISEQEGVGQLSFVARDVYDEHDFEVRVRYGEGIDQGSLESLVSSMTILPFQEAFPGVARREEDLEEGEPAALEDGEVRVSIEALDEGVASLDYAWTANLSPVEGGHVSSEESEEGGAMNIRGTSYNNLWIEPGEWWDSGVHFSCRYYQADAFAVNTIGYLEVYNYTMNTYRHDWLLPGVARSIREYSSTTNLRRVLVQNRDPEMNLFVSYVIVNCF